MGLLLGPFKLVYKTAANLLSRSFLILKTENLFDDVTVPAERVTLGNKLIGNQVETSAPCKDG